MRSSSKIRCCAVRFACSPRCSSISEPHLHGVEDLRKAALKLNEELAAKIRAGDADDGAWRARVMKAVRAIVEDKLRIANPRYLEADLAARKQS